MDKVHEQDNLRIFEQIAQVKVDWEVELAAFNDVIVLHIVVFQKVIHRFLKLKEETQPIHSRFPPHSNYDLCFLIGSHSKDIDKKRDFQISDMQNAIILQYNR